MPNLPANGITRALRHRNYRLFFTGQSISLVGTWVTRTAMSWLVYRLTGSVLVLGVVAFCGQLPTFLLTPIAGVLVDRWDRHRILVVTQFCAMVQSLVLAALTFWGTITVVELAILQAVQGLINAFETPARQSIVVQMVDDRADLANAIALNSSIVNGSWILGPALGGAMIAALGEASCFTIDGLSYIAVIVSLLKMRLVYDRPARRAPRIIRELRTGFTYVRQSTAIRVPLLLLAAIATLGTPYMTFMPVVAAGVLHGGPNTMGWLMAASGLGALVGGLYLASRRSVAGLDRVTVIATCTLGAGLVAFSLSHRLWLSLAILPFVGGGFMVQVVCANTTLQTEVAEHFRGRVMSYYGMAVFGGGPLGNLLAGIAAHRIGLPATLAGCGIACVCAGGWFGRAAARVRSQAGHLGRP